MIVPKNLVAGVLAFLVSTVAAVIYLGGPDLLTGRPIVFTGDASFHYMFAKVAMQDGWTWHSRFLGAPYGFSLAAFGVNLTPETAIMKVLELTTSDAVSLLNRTWIVCIGLTAVSGFAALRILRLPLLVSIVCGILFSLIPYMSYRHVGHFNLNFTFIAIPTALAVRIAAGRMEEFSARSFVALLACVALPGLAYIYYSFFLSFLLTSALVIAVFTRTARKSSIRGALCLVTLLVATGLNLLPTLISWKVDGKPQNLDYKSPWEADIYALQIRDLVLPDASSPMPLLKELGAKSKAVQWPQVNENQSAKLGTVGAVGFLLGLLILIGIPVPMESYHVAYARVAASLILALLLLSVSGGFGSLFNLFVVSDIRAYNRVAPLIALLSLFVMGAFLSWVQVRLVAFRPLGAGLLVLVLVFGLFEQNAAAHLRAEAAGNKVAAANLRSFVHDVEAALPKGAALFMVPITTFPADMNRNRMEGLDHAKPTLFSQGLHWSWPHFGRAHDSFVRALGPTTDLHFFDHLRSFGFTHIWMDQYGPVEEITAVTSNLLSSGAKMVIADPTDRYRVYELPPVKQGVPKQPVLIKHGAGFFGPATSNDGKDFQWAQGEAEIMLENTVTEPRSVRLIFFLQGFESDRYVELRVGDHVQRFPLTNITTEHAFDFTLPPSATTVLRLRTDAGHHTLADPRDLRFAFFAPRVIDLEK